MRFRDSCAFYCLLMATVRPGVRPLLVSASYHLSVAMPRHRSRNISSSATAARQWRLLSGEAAFLCRGPRAALHHAEPLYHHRGTLGYLRLLNVQSRIYGRSADKTRLPE